MTLHVYSCETSTIRAEMVKRTKPEGTFYGLRIHMNTDQVITYWAREKGDLAHMVNLLAHTILQTPTEFPSTPGQMARAS